VLDRAKLEKLPDRVATIVVGNPLIADANVQSGGMMVVTGKGYGVTNVLALDRTGNVLMDKSIEVRGPDVVVIYKGVERESYNCAPSCERRITLGDSQPYFDSTIGQTGTRNGQAQAAPASR
jgi:Flp pilus assembly secretin CpaC